MISEKVDIIIVTYNNWQATKLFLESIEKYTDSNLYKITCVDNGSTDETLEKINNYKNIKLIENNENLGYGKAVNIGIKNSDNKYLAILNNDLIVSKNWLDNWLDIFNKNDFAVLTTNSNTIDKFDDWIEFKKQNKSLDLEELFEKYYKNYDDFCNENSKNYENKIEKIESPIGFLGGWALLFERDLLSKVDGFMYDERFEYGFYEDVDFSWRVGLSGGKLGIAREIYLHHFINTTFDSMPIDKNAVAKINKEKFLDKWEDYFKNYLNSMTDEEIEKNKLLKKAKEYYNQKNSEG